MRTFVLAVLALASCACSPKPPAPSASPPSAATSAEDRRVLVCVGDSLTEGYGLDPEQAYPAQLQRKLEAEGLKWRVENSGYSGETTSGTRTRLDWVMKLEPDAVILEIGGNDGLRGIDPKITRENIAYLLDELERRDIPVMLAGMRTLANLGPDYTKPFEAIYPELAKEKGVPLIPDFLKGVAGDVKLNQKDRIHPTEEGYAIIVGEIAPLIVPWLKGLPEAAPTPAARSSP